MTMCQVLYDNVSSYPAFTVVAPVTSNALLCIHTASLDNVSAAKRIVARNECVWSNSISDTLIITLYTYILI